MKSTENIETKITNDDLKLFIESIGGKTLIKCVGGNVSNPMPSPGSTYIMNGRGELIDVIYIKSVQGNYVNAKFSSHILNKKDSKIFFGQSFNKGEAKIDNTNSGYLGNKRLYHIPNPECLANFGYTP